MPSSTQDVGLYVSVPFCRAKCSFCNFASGVGSPEAVERYVHLLCAEIRGAHAAAAAAGAMLPERVGSVYFGGGTPSLLEAAQMQAIFAAIRGEFRIESGAEITLEAAPGQIADACLETAVQCGVNRISLGVQSFVDREAQAVGRSHTEASCRAEFRRLQRAGISNVGADLIAGLPYQTERSWQQCLATATASELMHLSVYMLEVDAESRLGREVLGGGARLHAPAVPKDEAIAAMYDEACAVLPTVGLGQYEISNFAREGAAAQHNLRYWTREPYLGFGLDAHSMLTGEQGRALRWANPDALEAYTGAPEWASGAWVSKRDAFEETVFLGLRLVHGLAEEALAGFPRSWCEEFHASARMLEREGMLRHEGGFWALTQRGRLVSSEVFGELLVSVPAVA